MDAGPVEISRTFNAPRERLWQAWTDAGILAKWWGPDNYTGQVLKMEARVGGTFLAAMHSEDGKSVYSTGEYRVVKAPEKLVMTDNFADPGGNVVNAGYYGMGKNWPDELLVTVTFEDQGKGTLVHITHQGIPPDQIADCRHGWNESLDKLERVMDPTLPSPTAKARVRA